MLRPCQRSQWHHCGCRLNPFHLPSLGYFPPLSDKDLQLPSGFNCNFDFPEEPCGWMYDHAKWLRSTWPGSSSPNDRTFPGKPAAGPERKGLRPARCRAPGPRFPDKHHNFPPQGSPLLCAHKPPSLLTASPYETARSWFLALSWD